MSHDLTETSPKFTNSMNICKIKEIVEDLSLLKKIVWKADILEWIKKGCISSAWIKGIKCQVIGYFIPNSVFTKQAKIDSDTGVLRVLELVQIFSRVHPGLIETRRNQQSSFEKSDEHKEIIEWCIFKRVNKI